MPKVMVEVEVPDGWEFVRYGKPETGEYFLNSGLEVMGASNCIYHNRWVIVRKAWQWPEWLKAPWISMQPSQCWVAWDGEPYIEYAQSNSWCCQLGGGFSSLHSVFVDFTPPPCTDWRQSKRRNPRSAAPAAGEG